MKELIQNLINLISEKYIELIFWTLVKIYNLIILIGTLKNNNEIKSS